MQAPAANRPQPEAQTEKTFFYVIGGEFTDTSFEEVLTRSNQIHGPFRSHDEAMSKWRALSFQSTGNAQVRYEIAEVAHRMDRRTILLG
ncbi:MAG: hypothetical protein CME02_08615 [Geminicoccus sp.]|nr:hypothetical protein [Geminicoccus sp.]